jgi:deoxyribodipyrimidine photo-lyase
MVWLRRDLRLHDHPGLAAALAGGAPVVPVFCFDPALLAGRHRSAVRTRFLLESLRDLGEALANRESRLVVRVGAPAVELPALARAVGARACTSARTPGRTRAGGMPRWRGRWPAPAPS